MKITAGYLQKGVVYEVCYPYPIFSPLGLFVPTQRGYLGKNVSRMFGTAEVVFTPALQEDFNSSQQVLSFSGDAKDFLLHPTSRALYYTLEKVISESSASYKAVGTHNYTNITFTIKNGEMEARLLSKDHDAFSSPITNASHKVVKK